MAKLSAGERVSLLKSVSVFAELDAETLVALAQAVVEERVKARETIVRKGELGDSLYVIATGRVRVHDDRRHLAYLDEGEVFGEMAALSSEARSASVTAVEDSLLLKLAQEPFYQLAARRIEVARGIIDVLCRRLRDRVEDLNELRTRYDALVESAQEPDDSTLAAYVPMDRRQAIAAGEELAERALGSVAFVDVSGFTPLTEALTTELGARRGAEALTRHLNRVFGALVDEVHRTRGSVVAFSGDAITCFWDHDDGRRAVAATRAMQRIMAGFAAVEIPSGKHVPLAVKAAVAQGPVRRLLVGDPALQVVDLLVGATVDRVAMGDDLARPGEVVADGRVVEHLGKDLAVGAWRSALSGERFAVVGGLDPVPRPNPWPALPPGALDEALLRPWLLPAVHERLKSGQGDFLAELRRAVPLFLAFDGLDFEGDDEVGARLDAWVRFVQGVLARYEGTLVQLVADDKGCYLYAAFGAPVAHEDAPERALAAALALCSPPSEMSFLRGVRVGLSQGRLRTGAYGSSARRTYGMIGDETNLAARLMSRAADGQILVTERIAQATSARYRFRELGDVELKGKAEPVRVLEALGERRTAAVLADAALPMVGRRRELETLAGALGKLTAVGSSPIFLLTGEAGIGKSRLLAELAGLARDRGLPVLCAEADAIESATPFAAWRPVFRQVLELDVDEAAAAAEHVPSRVAALAPELAELAPLLGPVVANAPPENDHTASLSKEQRAWERRRLLLRLVNEAVADDPLVLLVDNAQWLDSASWDLLARVRRTIRPQLLVIAARPLAGSLPREAREVLRGPETRVLELGALAPDEVATLVGRHLGIGEVPAPLRALLGEKAEGNPFFSEELARALLDAGLIRIEDGVCHVERDLGGLEFPDTIEGLVTSRIDRLPAPLQLTLKVASVIGRVFAFPTLRDVFPVASEKEKVKDLVADLAALDLTPLHAAEPDPRYAFKHLITREVAYNLMLSEQRRQLHRKVAEWYERVLDQDPERLSTLAAHHWTRAVEGLDEVPPDLLRKVVDALEKAGRHAVASAAGHEAIRHFSHGLELLGELADGPERRARELGLRSSLGVSYLFAHGPTHEGLRDNLVRARELGEALGAPVFEVDYALWYHHLIRSDPEKPPAFAARLTAAADASGRRDLVLIARQVEGTTALYAGRFAAARELLAEAVALGEEESRREDSFAQARDPAAAANAYHGWALWYLGHPDQALQSQGRALALSEGAGRPATRLQVLVLGAELLGHRRDAAALETAEEAVAMARDHNLPFGTAIATSMMGRAKLERGEAEEAVALFRRSVEACGEDVLYYLPVTLTGLAAAHLACGEVDAAASTVEEASRLGERLWSAFYRAEVARLRGEVLARQGEDAAAERAFTEALGHARSQGARSLELRAATSLARLLGAHGRAAEGEAILAGVYGSFREGFDTGDLRDAKSLLEVLSTDGGLK